MSLKKIVWLGLIMCCSVIVTAQLCSGNLGDNIFEDGDFGSGTDNILRENPNIAPGYTYSQGTPPPDGLYVITNNTGAWSGLYSTWLSIRDNSDDPNGYMMVVNASFTTGAFYEQTIEGLCENTLYVFSADIINLIQKGVTNHIRPNVSFLIDDEIKYTTGEIPQTDAWNTYGFTFETGSNVTSVKLTLQNNAPGGIGNDLALDNITFRPCGPEALILPRSIADICEDGDPIELEATVIGNQYENSAFQWQRSFDEGVTWESIMNENSNTYEHTELASGFYYYRYLLSASLDNIENAKCRVNSNIKVVNVVPKFYTIVDTLCQGLNFKVGTSIYSETGIYTDSLISSLGCDSIVTLDLTIVPDRGINATTLIEPPICFGDSNAQIQVTNPIDGYPPYNIGLNESIQQNEGSWQNLSSGNYTIKIEDRFGCQFDTVLSVIDPALFQIDIGDDQDVELGDGILFSLNTNYPISKLEWLSDAIDCPTNCLDELIYPKNSSVYPITAFSDAGCTASDSVFIEVQKTRKLYIPTAFSPNFDGINDRFTLYGDEPNVQRIMSLQIFDRWGNLIYKANDMLVNDPNVGWNGSFNGKELDKGVYLYQADVLYFDGIIEKVTGDIFLMR